MDLFTLILSLFRHGFKAKITTPYFILIGKKTNSSLTYMTCYHLDAYYKLLPKLSKNEYYQTIEALINKGLLDKDGDVVCLSSNGKQWLDDHVLVLPHLNQWLWGECDNSFWRYMLFMQQVLSEKAYHCSDYTPLIVNPSIQQMIKSTLQRMTEPFAQWLPTYYAELQQYMQQLSSIQQYIVSQQWIGHRMYGKTLDQLALETKLTTEELSFHLKDSIHLLLADMHHQLYPVMQSLYNVHIPLQPIVQQCFYYIQQGITDFTHLAKKLHRKEGTIEDYVIELYLKNKIDISPWIAPSLYEYQQCCIQRYPNIGQWTYATIQSLVDMPLTFFQFRCLQLHCALESR